MDSPPISLPERGTVGIPVRRAREWIANSGMLNPLTVRSRRGVNRSPSGCYLRGGPRRARRCCYGPGHRHRRADAVFRRSDAWVQACRPSVMSLHSKPNKGSGDIECVPTWGDDRGCGRTARPVTPVVQRLHPVRATRRGAPMPAVAPRPVPQLPAPRRRVGVRAGRSGAWGR